MRDYEWTNKKRTLLINGEVIPFTKITVYDGTLEIELDKYKVVKEEELE